MKKRVWIPLLASFGFGLFMAYSMNSGDLLDPRDICAYQPSRYLQFFRIEEFKCYLDIGYLFKLVGGFALIAAIPCLIAGLSLGWLKDNGQAQQHRG